MNLTIGELTVKVHFYSADEKELLGLLLTEARVKNRTAEELILMILYHRYHEQRLKVVEKSDEQKLTEGC